MKPKISPDTWLALFFLVTACVLIFIWIPLDTDSGIVETVRRKFVIGDALGPTVAATVIGLGALLAVLRPTQDNLLSLQNIAWMLSLIGVFAASLLVMRYAGPLAAFAQEGGYRPLRATPPWHYIGFLLGGTLMIGGLTGFAQRRWKAGDFAIGFAAALVIALLYDVPFDDLILPPNGDV
ncbi:MAG: hypothetical protein AAF943_16940 [Pseudomonadota bacterium]